MDTRSEPVQGQFAPVSVMRDDIGPEELYPSLGTEWHRASTDRPWVSINMVATIDGKIVTGERGEPVQDLGSRFDHSVMRVLQSAADAVLIGAGSQRSSKGITYPAHLLRFVVTQSGNVDANSRFFLDEPAKAVVACPESAELPELPGGTKVLRSGVNRVEWGNLLRQMRGELGVERLLVEGGSEVNGELLRLNFVDELFLTVAPKIKLGDGVPTYAGGEPLLRVEVQNYALVSSTQVGNELFLRYRRIWN